MIQSSSTIRSVGFAYATLFASHRAVHKEIFARRREDIAPISRNPGRGREIPLLRVYRRQMKAPT
jgi:hypothetical protein